MDKYNKVKKAYHMIKDKATKEIKTASTDRTELIKLQQTYE